MKYRVWVSIEEQDDENDHYEDVGLPDPASAEFGTLDEAQAVLRRILAQYNPESLSTSDHRERSEHDQAPG